MLKPLRSVRNPAPGILCEILGTRLSKFLTAFTLLTGLLLLGVNPVRAQDEEPVDPPPKLVPVLIFNVASIDRSLNDISNMFQVAGRPDMMDVIQGFLGEKADNLKGFDKSRPLGYMVFLEPTLPPRPRLVFYLPVENETDFVNTLRLGPAPITEVGEHEYEIENRGRRGKTPLKIQGDYAFMLPTGEGFLKGETFPDPRKVSADLTSRYDVAFSIRLRGIPPLIREVFGTYLSQQFSTQMQQRDFESDASYESRKAQGLNMMEYLQQLLRDGDEVTLGLDATENGRRAVLELSTFARPDSEFAKALTGIAGKQSYFTPLLQQTEPLQVSMSWKLNAREEKALLGHLKAMRIGLRQELDTAPEHTINQFVDALEATVKGGHLDALIQFQKRPDGMLVIAGGVKIVGSEAVGSSLRGILSAVNDKRPDANIQIDYHEFQGVKFCRIPSQTQNEDWFRLYGGVPDLYLGTGNGVLWFAFGGKETLSVLEKAIETSNTAPPRPDLVTSAPFQAIFCASSWLSYVNRSDLDTPQGELVKEALKAERDRVRLEVVPLESGARLSMQFDEGFVQLLGSLLAQLYDRTQL